jgi:hypothetical protein
LHSPAILVEKIPKVLNLFLTVNMTLVLRTQKSSSVLLDFGYFMYHKMLSWLCFFPKGEKEPLYFLQSGCKVAYYIIEVVTVILYLKI